MRSFLRSYVAANANSKIGWKFWKYVYDTCRTNKEKIIKKIEVDDDRWMRWWWSSRQMIQVESIFILFKKPRQNMFTFKRPFCRCMIWCTYILTTGTYWLYCTVPTGSHYSSFKKLVQRAVQSLFFIVVLGFVWRGCLNVKKSVRNGRLLAWLILWLVAPSSFGFIGDSTPPLHWHIFITLLVLIETIDRVSYCTGCLCPIYWCFSLVWTTNNRQQTGIFNIYLISHHEHLGNKWWIK